MFLWWNLHEFWATDLNLFTVRNLLTQVTIDIVDCVKHFYWHAMYILFPFLKPTYFPIKKFDIILK